MFEMSVGEVTDMNLNFTKAAGTTLVPHTSLYLIQSYLMSLKETKSPLHSPYLYFSSSFPLFCPSYLYRLPLPRRFSTEPQEKAKHFIKLCFCLCLHRPSNRESNRTVPTILWTCTTSAGPLMKDTA